MNISSTPTDISPAGNTQVDRNPLPLGGLRIVDLTHVWSGPSATRLLAGLGAEVIKIEGPSRPDFLRGTGHADVPSRYPDQKHGRDPGNRNAWFNTVNTDKRGITVNLKDPDGLRLLHQMIAESHVLIANYRAGVLPRMGLGYEQLKAIRPSIIVVEMTGYGSVGPMSAMQSYGAQFDAMSGAAWLTGDGKQPLLTGFALSDPVAGLSAACAVVSAVARLRRTGEGCYVEVIQRDAMVPLLGEYVLEASVDDLSPTGLNDAEEACPHGLFQLGDDSWVAIAVEDEPAFHALLDQLDDAARAQLADVGTHASAMIRRDEVNAAVRAWCRRRTDAAALSGQLQVAGVPAGPVSDGRDVYGDEQLRENGFFRRLEHPSAGAHDYPGPPLTLNDQRFAPRSPAPVFDQDTDAVLRAVCGLDADEISALRERGVVGAALS